MKSTLNISPKQKILFQGIAGIVIGFFFLWLSTKDISLSQISELLSQLNTNWLVISIFIYLCSIIVRIFRWQHLLKKVKRISLLSTGKALSVGYAMNNILPARLGELVRANFLAKHSRLSKISIFSSIVLERTLDGLIVVGCLIIGRLFIANHSTINQLTIAASLLFIPLFLILWLLSQGKHQIFLSKLPPIISNRIHNFSVGVSMLSSNSLISIVLLSMLIWFFEAISMWSILFSIDVVLNWQQMLSLLGVINLSTLIPSPPGFIGTYQYAYALMMSMFAYPEVKGLVAATITQIFLFGTITIIGLLIYGYINLFQRK